MIHHFCFGANNAKRAARFYGPVPAVLGLRRMNMRDGSLTYAAE